MAKHNIRPRVLEAVYRLRNFTVQELCEAAQLEDRNVAYNQLGNLADKGYLAPKTLPATAAHRPKNLYRLTEDPSRLLSLAEEISSYRPLQPAFDARAAESAVSNARMALLLIEGELNTLDPATKDSKKIEQYLNAVRSLEQRLQAAKIELETAILETPQEVTPASSPQHPVMIEMARWREAISRRAVIEKRLLEWQAELTQAELVRESVRAITAAAFGRGRIPALRRSLLRKVESRPAVEAFMDSLEADLETPLLVRAHLVERALRAHDLNVVRLCFQGREPTGSRWWRYNQLTTEFLSTGFREEAWVACWNELQSWRQPAERIPLKRVGTIGLYLYGLDNLTQQGYVNLADRHRISVITPRPLDFLSTAQETIGPTLVDVASLIIAGSEPKFGTIGVGQLEFPFAPEQNPIWRLYGYGPVVFRIRQWPGAPAIRVAVSLHRFGLSLPKIEKATMALAKEQKGLMLIQSERTSSPDHLTNRVRSVLDSVEELAVF